MCCDGDRFFAVQLFIEPIATPRESDILVALSKVDVREYLWSPYLAPY